jgi:hypothetical protein
VVGRSVVVVAVSAFFTFSGCRPCPARSRSCCCLQKQGEEQNGCAEQLTDRQPFSECHSHIIDSTFPTRGSNTTSMEMDGSNNRGWPYRTTLRSWLTGEPVASSNQTGQKTGISTNTERNSRRDADDQENGQRYEQHEAQYRPAPRRFVAPPVLTNYHDRMIGSINKVAFSNVDGHSGDLSFLWHIIGRQ